MQPHLNDDPAEWREEIERRQGHIPEEDADRYNDAKKLEEMEEKNASV